MKSVFRRTLAGFSVVPVRICFYADLQRAVTARLKAPIFHKEVCSLTAVMKLQKVTQTFHDNDVSRPKQAEEPHILITVIPIFSILGGNTAGGDHGDRSVLVLLLTHRRRLLNGCHIIRANGFYELQSVKNSRTPRFKSK